MFSFLRSTRLPRLFWWLVFTVLLLALIGTIYPQQLPLSLYKLSLVTMAGVVGYWLDRSIFPYARPDMFSIFETDSPCSVAPDDPIPVVISDSLPEAILFAAAMVRRAVIVGCAMLAIGLGA